MECQNYIMMNKICRDNFNITFIIPSSIGKYTIPADIRQESMIVSGPRPPVQSPEQEAKKRTHYNHHNAIILVINQCSTNHIPKIMTIPTTQAASHGRPV